MRYTTEYMEARHHSKSQEQLQLPGNRPLKNPTNHECNVTTVQVSVISEGPVEVETQVLLLRKHKTTP